ncbi:MAG: DUF885 family protein, partial [Mycetocola sp.]
MEGGDRLPHLRRCATDGAARGVGAVVRCRIRRRTARAAARVRRQARGYRRESRARAGAGRPSAPRLRPRTGALGARRLRNWQRDAVFLFSQIVGPWFDLLLQPPPFHAERRADLVTVLTAMPDAVDGAIANLAEHGVASLARVAIGMLDDIGERLATSVTAVADHVDDETRGALTAALPPARDALERYRAWLEQNADDLGPDAIVGREAFVWYLRHVALIAGEPEELVRTAEQDHRRAVAAEAAARASFASEPEPPVAASVDAEVSAEIEGEREVRVFYESRDLLSQPESLRHYEFAATPAYLEPFAMFGVTDDLGNHARIETATSYIPEPSTELPYFDAASARDPRLGIIHEGVHAQQLALSWG